MKLLLATALLLSIAWGSGEEKKKEIEKSRNVIAHVAYDTPATFGFGNNFYLDVDKDGTNDFMFTTVMVSNETDIHTKYLVNALDNNEVLSVEGSAAINEDGMPVAELGNVTWSTNASEIIEQVYTGSMESWNGTWSGDRDQYIGIKLVKDGKSYNGWVKVSIDQANETAFVKGYAINRAPNGSIMAGQI